MADLLTHVLVAYVLATLLSWRYDWLTPPFVTVAMIGAAIPDLNRLDLVVPSETITAVTGVPFDWGAFHVLGGSLLAVAIGALLTAPPHRRRVAGLLLLGVASHHALDVLLIDATGYSYPVFWPLTDYQPPSGNLYLSTDRWPAAVSAVLAGVVWYARYHR
ncbi:metal-dependent hydrolase [Natronolimnohabitans innermongolicus]|uniref:Membrane-bound metal-dependent hydrolase n=1 Tax=Natronolimnohabitans innermongolicus JCM 12255 TaxID=1227499 RepID=L9XG94_9EURY|nr:metal-dependent hydrolase [Natronolimnohabitans innermongolicus]ELY60740.1 hypothetical protein C493_03517 [Natronolimnohabitans innermongolicus JCM 12255]